jgi:hypothetical protein
MVSKRLQSNARTFGTAILAVAVLGSVAEPAHSVPIEWNLSGVTFEDGGIAFGSFVLDLPSRLVLEWSVAVAGGNEAVYSPFIYSPFSAQAYVSGPIPPREPILIFHQFPELVPEGQPRLRELRITPAATLDGSLALVPLLTFLGEGDVGSEECLNCSPFRSISGGSFSFSRYRSDIVNVAEPSLLEMLISGVLAIGLRFIGISGRRSVDVGR